MKAIGRMLAGFGRLPAAVRVAGTFAAVVTAGAGVLSWDALRWGAGELGIDPNLTWLYPVVADGMIATATVGAVVTRAQRTRTRVYVWLLLGSGIAISVVGNAAHASGGTELFGPITLHRLGSAMPALALAAALHLLVIIVRATVTHPAGDARGITVAEEHVASIMQGQRAELTRRRLEGEAEAAGMAGGTATNDRGGAAEPVTTAAIDRPPGLPIPGAVATRPVTGGMAAKSDLGDRDTATPAGTANGHDSALAEVVERASADEADGHANDQQPTAVMTAEEARAAVVRLLRQARRRGRAVTTADVQRVTGRKARQARRLLGQATAAVTAPGDGAEPDAVAEVER